MLNYILIALLFWPVVGAVVLAILDTKDQRFFRWYAAAPSPWLGGLVLFCWPVLAIYVIRVRLGQHLVSISI